MNWTLPIRRAFKAKTWNRLIDLAYHDQARLIEWLTLILLLNFCQEFYFNPGLVDRDIYAAFAHIGANGWVIITGIAALFQAFVIFWQGPWSAELRSFAMIISVAFWLTVTLAFASSAVSTTATYNYLGLFVGTFFAWLFLLWKTAGPS